jgi:hypothetical protein
MMPLKKLLGLIIAASGILWYSVIQMRPVESSVLPKSPTKLRDDATRVVKADGHAEMARHPDRHSESSSMARHPDKHSEKATHN